MWQPQLDAVPAGWRVIAPDYRGFSESSPPSPATMNDLAGDLVDLLDRLESTRSDRGGMLDGRLRGIRASGQRSQLRQGARARSTRARARTRRRARQDAEKCWTSWKRKARAPSRMK
jgi:hypothetical protein